MLLMESQKSLWSCIRFLTRTTFIQIGLQSDSSIRMILARSFKKCTKARDTILLGKSSTTRLVLLLFAETKTSTLKLLVVLITRQL